MGSNEEITLERLIEGRSRGLCYTLIANLDTIALDLVLNDLGIERLRRKAYDLSRRYEEEDYNWSQTTYSIILYYLLGKTNRNAAQRLSRIIPHSVLMRENSSLHKIEALLLGGAGLLDLYSDSYVVHLREEFYHLAAKYNITPLSPEDWQLQGIYLNNHPTLRLAQLAACIHKNTISMSSFSECQDQKSIHMLFSHAASDYWIDTLSRYSNERGASPKIGSTMSSIIAINAIAPLLFTYSNYVESCHINEKALDILYSLRAEDNIYIRKWHSFKPVARNAFDSQALIQLSTEYCKHGRCAECPLAKRLIESTM